VLHRCWWLHDPRLVYVYAIMPSEREAAAASPDTSETTLRRVIRQTRLVCGDLAEKPLVQATIVHPERTLYAVDAAFSRAVSVVVRRTRETLAGASPLLPVAALGLSFWGGARVYRRLRELVLPSTQQKLPTTGLHQAKRGP